MGDSEERPRAPDEGQDAPRPPVRGQGSQGQRRPLLQVAPRAAEEAARREEAARERSPRRGLQEHRAIAPHTGTPAPELTGEVRKLVEERLEGYVTADTAKHVKRQASELVAKIQ